MIYYIITFFIGLTLGSCIIYFLFSHKLKEKQQLDYSEAKELQVTIQRLQDQKSDLLKNIEQKQQEWDIHLDSLQKELFNICKDIATFKKEKENKEFLYNQLNIKILELDTKRKEILNNINNLEQQQKEAAKKFYDNAKEVAQQSFENELDNIYETLEANRQEAQDIYLKELTECVNNFNTEISFKKEELDNLNHQLQELQNIVDSITTDRKRQAEMDSQQDFYRLQLNSNDILEIKKLKEILPYLRNPEPLNKVIYKVYYEKPYNDLVGRVLGPEKRTGIYKITNMLDGKVYVGQSVNAAERWRQHIKRGVGAEPPTRNKLYPAMLAIGVENFTFEWIEDCEPNKLDEREQFYQSFFHAKDWGYSIK